MNRETEQSRVRKDVIVHVDPFLFCSWNEFDCCIFAFSYKKHCWNNFHHSRKNKQNWLQCLSADEVQPKKNIFWLWNVKRCMILLRTEFSNSSRKFCCFYCSLSNLRWWFWKGEEWDWQKAGLGFTYVIGMIVFAFYEWAKKVISWQFRYWHFFVVLHNRVV